MTLPDEFSELNSLTHLDLSRNKLCALPEEVQELKSLQMLNLSSNSLVRIPPSIRGMKSLRKLDLRDNPLLRTFPTEIGSLPSLKDLRVDRILSNDKTIITLRKKSEKNGVCVLLQ
mmetsp:Transcript_14981/g.23912  ORF Transcript_14981/g.23912 Transcript_14981/m.23912 type:complete len:116 (+) Transcript_14981:351-698(+)